MTLWSDFQTNQGSLIHKWKHYFPIYERHLKDFVNKPVIFIEIGCGQGGSLSMWKRYLGPLATIVGLDINPACRAFEQDQISVRIGNQADHGFLQSVLDEFGQPDVVLDDGSHVMSHINASFDFLYQRVARNGLYIVEDLHTAYWEDFEGGLERRGTFIERTKGLIDELHGEWTPGHPRKTLFTRTTLSMHIYDSLVVFERGVTPTPKIFGSQRGTVGPG